jgi:hypothetical protein
VIDRSVLEPPCQHLRLLVGGAMVALLVLAPLFAAEPSGESTQSATGGGDEPARPGVIDAQSKREALSFGLVMLAGIILGGAMLLVLVVVWGNRARRLARRPLPPVSQRDELWFLKPKKDFGEDPGDFPESGPASEPETK